MAHIAGVKWGKYHTGKDMVTLTYNETTGGYQVHFELLHRHNEPHKPVGMQGVIARAVAQHSADLVAPLGKREVKLIFGTEDFPILYLHDRLRVPSFHMCTVPAESPDIPVPDFTWELYNQAKYVNTSWWDLRALLLLKGAMLPWRWREADLFMRGDAGVGYRKTLVPLFTEARRNKSELALFGLRTNAYNTGFYASDDKRFSWLDNWCQHRYLIHTSGFSYSASLKYKLACGAVVVSFESKYREFYYPALQPGVHYLSFPEGSREELIERIAPRIKAALAKLEAEHPDKAPPVALAAREFATSQLTPGALSCYWYKAIVAYSALYFAATGAEVPAEVKLA